MLTHLLTKTSLTVLFFVAVAFLDPQGINAQTRYTCQWTGVTCLPNMPSPCEASTNPTICGLLVTELECTSGGPYLCDSCGHSGESCCNPAYNNDDPPGGCANGTKCNTSTKTCQPCGGAGQGCCGNGTGASCSTGLYCHTPTNPGRYASTGGTQCIKCGDARDQCCTVFTRTGSLNPAPPAGGCNNGLTCNGNTCSCGGLGQLCCSDGSCSDPNAVCAKCNPTTGECGTESKCFQKPPPDCGGSGQICCSTGTACGSGLLCDGSNKCSRPTYEDTCDSSDPDNYFNTAIGKIPICSVQDTVAAFLRWSIGISGGLAFIFYFYSGILSKLSEGDPRRFQLSKEIFFSTSAAVLLLTFSVFILKILGFDILTVFNL